VFTDRKERRLKDKVLKIVRDEFMNVFGMKVYFLQFKILLRIKFADFFS